MDRTEKASELIEEAEQLGVHLKSVVPNLAFAVKQMVTGDLAERQEAICIELAKYLPEVRRLTELHAIAVRARAFIGKKILLRDGHGLLEGTDGYGTGQRVSIVREGVLKDVGGSGELTISVVRDGNSQTVTARAEDLLIVLDDEGEAGASSPGSDAQASEKPRKGILERFRR
jgi:hypothetical protein